MPSFVIKNLQFLCKKKGKVKQKAAESPYRIRRLNVCVVCLLVKGLYIPGDFLTESRLASVDVATTLVCDFHHLFLR